MAVVRFEQVADVGHIILCNPPENELGKRFADDLRAAVDAASGARLRAVLVRSEGPNFGTGGDVAEWPGKTVDWFHAFISETNGAYKALEALRVPTIAAVRGKAVGGHLELVLHCDLIVAARTSSFHAIETRTGMVQIAGGFQRTADRVGSARATELALLAEPLSGERAGEIGLACRVVEDDELDAVSEALAKQLAAGPTLAYGAVRALTKAWSAGGVAGADDLLLDLTMRLFETDDAQQAFKALKDATAGGGDKSKAEANAQTEFSGR